MFRSLLFSALCVLTLCCLGCGGGTTGSSGLATDPSDPVSMVGAPVSALLDNDVAALVALMPADEIAKARAEWPEMRDEMAQQLSMGLPMIATEDGVNQIKQTVRAQVEASADQIKGGIGMASGAGWCVGESCRRNTRSRKSI